MLRVTFQGRGPGGLGPPLVLDQTEARRAQKIFLGDQASPFSTGLDDPPLPTPLYLKACIRHCFVLSLPYLGVKAVSSICRFLDKKTLLEILLNPGLYYYYTILSVARLKIQYVSPQNSYYQIYFAFLVLPPPPPLPAEFCLQFLLDN